MKQFCFLILLVTTSILAHSQVVSTPYSGFSSPTDVVFNKTNNMFIVSPTTVYKITPTGTRSFFASGFSTATSLAVDNIDNIYVGDYATGKITKITSSGVSSIFATGFNTITTLAFNPLGDLYVTEYMNPKICKVVAGGRQVFASIPSIRTVGLQFDETGNAYVAGGIGTPSVFNRHPGRRNI